MQWLTNNPLLNLSGPAFLQIYLLFVAGAIIWTLIRTRTSDTTRDLPVPTLPVEFDPLEIAYLRGGEPEILRLTLFDLIARGYLRHSGEKENSIGQPVRTPSAEYLTPYERAVFNAMATPRKVGDIFPGVERELTSNGHGRVLRRELEERLLLRKRDESGFAWSVLLPACLFVIGVGLWKLLVALSRGRHNVWFLVLLMAVALAGLFIAARRSRLTALGKAYLARLREALQSLQFHIPSLIGSGGSSDHLTLAVAVFGIGILSGTSYAFYPEMFKRAAQNDSGPEMGHSSCGSSCGSGCGGGGCGGGCGGCGGG